MEQPLLIGLKEQGLIEEDLDLYHMETVRQQKNNDEAERSDAKGCKERRRAKQSEARSI
jgi:hypothetical protein